MRTQTIIEKMHSTYMHVYMRGVLKLFNLLCSFSSDFFFFRKKKQTHWVNAKKQQKDHWQHQYMQLRPFIGTGKHSCSVEQWSRGRETAIMLAQIAASSEQKTIRKQTLEHRLDDGEGSTNSYRRMNRFHSSSLSNHQLFSLEWMRLKIVEQKFFAVNSFRWFSL